MYRLSIGHYINIMYVYIQVHCVYNLYTYMYISGKQEFAVFFQHLNWMFAVRITLSMFYILCIYIHQVIHTFMCTKMWHNWDITSSSSIILNTHGTQPQSFATAIFKQNVYIVRYTAVLCFSIFYDIFTG